MFERINSIEKDSELSIRRQSELLNINRSRIYYRSILCDESELMHLIEEIYRSSDCRYGYRKVHAALTQLNRHVNKKKIQRLMQEMGIQGLYPKKHCKLSQGNPVHTKYPYLLEGLTINHANQVWATDITYIKLPERMMYFIAIIDLYSRYIVHYGINHSLEADFYVYILSEALKKGAPDIFNTDQGSQFTSKAFIDVLSFNKVKISMDHKGRCFDNIFVERLWRTIKQEAVYYYRPSNIRELEKILNEFVTWYNQERLHQALDYQKPAEVYFSST
jgi:putative transposase